MTNLRDLLRWHPSELALTAFLHGELSEAECSKVVRHLEDCARCRQSAERFEGAARICQTNVSDEVSAEDLVRGREALLAALRSNLEDPGLSEDRESDGSRDEVLAQFSEVASSYLGSSLATDIANTVRERCDKSGSSPEEALNQAMPRLAELVGEEAAEELRRQVMRELMGA